MENVKCEICGDDKKKVIISQTDLLHFISQEEFYIVQCTACGFRYLNPRPTPSEISKFYPDQYLGSATKPRNISRISRWILEDYYGYPPGSYQCGLVNLRKIFLWPEKVRRNLLGKSYLPYVGNGRLLDVGCGNGIGGAILRQQGWEVCGLDSSPACVEQARKILGEMVELGDLATCSFEKESFDAILMSHSLEHMHFPSDVLKEARTLLKARGALFVRVPNAQSMEAKIFGRWWVQWDPPRHLYHFDKKSLAYLLKKNRFQILSISTGSTPAYFMGSLERVIQNRLGKKLPFRNLIEKVIARPVCLLAGHLGLGTEIILLAKKT